jgi:hypothetical protein
LIERGVDYQLRRGFLLALEDLSNTPHRPLKSAFTGSLGLLMLLPHFSGNSPIQ